MFLYTPKYSCFPLLSKRYIHIFVYIIKYMLIINYPQVYPQLNFLDLLIWEQNKFAKKLTLIFILHMNENKSFELILLYLFNTLIKFKTEIHFFNIFYTVKKFHDIFNIGVIIKLNPSRLVINRAKSNKH